MASLGTLKPDDRPGLECFSIKGGQVRIHAVDCDANPRSIACCTSWASALLANVVFHTTFDSFGTREAIRSFIVLVSTPSPSVTC